MLQNRKAELAEACMRLMSSAKGGRDEAAPAGRTEPGFRIGAGLREARERLGWALPDVAAGLRLW